VIKFNNNTLNIQQYNFTPHPYVLPDFMDIFSWSLPFIAEKITDMLHRLVKRGDNESKTISKDLKKEYEEVIKKDQKQKEVKEEELATKFNAIKQKIRFVGKMNKMVSTLREEREALVELRGFCPGHKIPRGILLSGKNEITSALDSFKKATDVDKTIEKQRPKEKD